MRFASPRGTGGVATVLALLLGATAVLAQTAPAQRAQQQRPAAPATPAAPQAGQQPANGGPTVVQVKPEPSQPDWTKVCGKDQNANAEICYTTRDFVSDQGQPVLAVAVYDVKAQQPQRIVRFLMPLGLLLQPGIRFSVDNNQATAGRYAICFPNGCFAEANVPNDFVNSLKRGANLNVSVQNQAGREVTFAVPLTGFAKAFDGPPIDPKVLEEQQKKLQEELQKRSEDLRKRLESTAGAAGGSGAAAPTTPAAPAPRQ